MPAAARSLRTILERAATTAAERGVEVTITLPDGTVIAARPTVAERTDDLALVDMSKR